MFWLPGQGAGMINTAAGVAGMGGSVDVNSGDNGGSWDILGRGDVGSREAIGRGDVDSEEGVCSRGVCNEDDVGSEGAGMGWMRGMRSISCEPLEMVIPKLVSIDWFCIARRCLGCC